jgi:hypothetical protein
MKNDDGELMKQDLQAEAHVPETPPPWRPSALEIAAAAGGFPPPPPPSGSDTQAPSTPTGLTVTATTKTTVSLRWNASTDNVGVTGYRIYRSGAVALTTASTTATVGGLTCGRIHWLEVQALDAAGNASGKQTVIARTAAC